MHVSDTIGPYSDPDAPPPCARVHTAGWLWGDRSSTPQNATMLTSGGEEMFFGTAYFFNKTYAILPDAVVTEHVTLSEPVDPTVPVPLTAAAIFDERPITFGGDGLRLFWQNGAWRAPYGVKCYARNSSNGNQ